MVEESPPFDEVITVGAFVAHAERLTGDAERLRRRLGISRTALDSMRVSTTPMLGDDAQALIETFGLHHLPPAAPVDQPR